MSSKPGISIYRTIWAFGSKPGWCFDSKVNQHTICQECIIRLRKLGSAVAHKKQQLFWTPNQNGCDVLLLRVRQLPQLFILIRLIALVPLRAKCGAKPGAMTFTKNTPCLPSCHVAICLNKSRDERVEWYKITCMIY